MFHVALYEPKIPSNAGNIIRLAANCGVTLHFIGKINFEFSDKNLLRAGLDYHDIANLKFHQNFVEFLSDVRPNRVFALTTKGKSFYHHVSYQKDDVLLFGAEDAGLPQDVVSLIDGNNLLRVPMFPNNRSMNLANTVALVTYEAWRQLDFYGGM